MNQLSLATDSFFKTLAAIMLGAMVSVTLPVGVLVASAETTGISAVPSSVATTTSTRVNFKVSTTFNASTTAGTYITVTDNGGGGSFYNGTIDGECNDGTPDSDNKFAIDQNKGVCYSNDTAGNYTLTIDLFDSSDAAIGDSVDVSATITDPVPPEENAVCDVNCEYTTLAAAVAGETDGQIITMKSQVHTITSTVTVNKQLTIVGEAGSVIRTSGGNIMLIITADGVVLETLDVEKTDAVNQNIVQINANNVTVRNSSFSGTYALGDGQVTRAFEVVGGKSGLLLTNNTITNLRQPAYINNGTSGDITDNYVSDTRGWVIVSDTVLSFTGNSWGTNAVDIAIISQNSSANLYPCEVVAQMAADNDHALIDNQVQSPACPIDPVSPPTTPTLSGEVIYDAIPDTLPSSYPSLGFQATQTYEFGDEIAFASSTGRDLESAAITLTSWACQSGQWNNGNCKTSLGATFSHPITLNIYEVATGGGVGALIDSVTDTFDIPYRPSADSSCTDTKQWKDTNGGCYNGYNHVIVFDLTGITVPDSIIFGVAFDTQSYGDTPKGSDGPYNSLNVALNTATSVAPYIGTDVDADIMYRDEDGDGFQEENDWSDYRVAATFTAEIPVPPTTETVEVTGDTAAGENQPGWLFNRDTSTATPYEFGTSTASIGDGSLYVLPIGSNASDKFIAEYFALTDMNEINSFAYDFNIGANATTTDANEFYLSVYANFGVSSSTKFYDCRYSVVPTSGVVGGWTTVTFDPDHSYPVTTRTGGEASPYSCPNIPADMGKGAVVRAFAINLGDTSANDEGVDGYFDNVVFDTDAKITTFDFEPVIVPSETDEDDGGGGGGGRRNGPTPQVLGASTDDDILELLNEIEARLYVLLAQSYVSGSTRTTSGPSATPTVAGATDDGEVEEDQTDETTEDGSATSTPSATSDEDGEGREGSGTGIIEMAWDQIAWILVVLWLLATAAAFWYRNNHPESTILKFVQGGFGALGVALLIALFLGLMSAILWPALILAVGALGIYLWAVE